MAKPTKILIIRFSSIGDIVLTTPVIRMAKKQIPNAEVHFLTKQKFKSTVEHNPYIDKLYTVKDKLSEVIDLLKNESYDFVVDLHKNLRSSKIKRALKVESASFEKLNIEKWLLVNFKQNRMPDVHIVDRYLETLTQFGVKNDNQGLDYFTSDKDSVKLSELPETFKNGYLGWVIGGSYYTKMLPTNKVIEIGKRLQMPVVLLGGPEDKEKGDEIVKRLGKNFYNACGKFSLNQSASLVQQASKIITNDTGLMHIAAAYKKPILSFWGNTVPEFGMTPYLPQQPEKSTIIEIKDLNCRPCSKLGYKKKCPKKHFYCMQLIDVDEVVDWCQS